jgi:thioredoxin 1
LATKIVDVTDDDFEEQVLEDDLPVLVDFYKDDCESCELIAPTFKALAKEFDGKIKFARAHASTCSAAEDEHGVESYPTLTLFKDGEKVEDVPWNPGLPSEDEIRDFLTGHLEDDEDEDDEDEDEDDEDEEEDEKDE